ncbi:MAG TPA: carbamoyltransferase C-terminal domain-containing protein [Vicinamibacterales bacterium]|nr:carbamoyltransferase C-terminal domain-containing protein [Vicinamibacterales bacterium]
MKVIGLSPLDKDSTVTIVEDGEITYAAGEERFSRVKLQDGFPWRALADALQATNTQPGDVASVVYPFLGWEEETRLFERNLANEREFIDEGDSPETSAEIKAARARVPNRTAEIPGLRDPNERMEKGVAKTLAYRFLGNDSVVSRNVAKRGSTRWGRDASAFHRKWHEELESSLEDFGLSAKLKRVEHHISHAANAYYNSGFDEALIVTLDGYGSGLAGSVSVGRAGRIERLHCLEYPHSLGTFYESVTSSLGFKPSRHEGKIVGLAAYGDPAVLRDVLLSRFDQEEGNFRIREVNNVYFSRLLATEFPKIDVAAAYQHVLERVACTYVGHYIKKTGLEHIVLSGGVAANVKLNQRLKEIPGVAGIFIHPNMGDGGCGTGAALIEFAGRNAAALSKPLGDVYLGPSYSSDEIAEALGRAQLPFTKYTPIEPKIAALIAAGKVVARFNGRMEYGPRALGNRSILYHAKEPAVNQWLNQRLGRTEFMPFAPATLLEKRHECYLNTEGGEHAAMFMTLTFDCTEAMKRDSPAAVHVDGTARPQFVSAESNPSFYRILTEYHQLTGIPSLINTSFNMHEEPIVCSPDDAIRAFLQGNLDCLAIGDFLVAHPSSRQ